MNQASDLRPLPSTALLGGVHVVELSRHVAGAYCGLILAQLGASVSRYGPPTDAAGSQRTRAAMQQVIHRGKRAGTLADDAALQADLAGAHIVIVEVDERQDELAKQVAAIIERRAGLGPQTIVLVLSADGSSDGFSPGCGLTSSAWAGMSWAIGEPSREPLTPPFDIVDYETGVSAAAAALAAHLSGAGAACSPVDVSSRDVLSHLVSTLAQNYLPFGRQWQRDGRRPFMSGGIYPLGLFTCKDGFVALYCRSDEQWHGILRAMGDPAWGREERFRDPRVVARKHEAEADSHLLPWLAELTKSDIMAKGIEYGFPASPVMFVGEALDNPQFGFRGSLESVAIDDAQQSSVKVPTEPWRLYERPALPAKHAPKPWPTAQSAQPAQFLKGLRVLDLSWVWSGPLVASLLADLGAEVIKIEHPSRLDSVRQRGRPLRDGHEVPGPVAELNPWFNQLNHGKRSVVLDIKSPQDRARLLELAATCDIVVENMRPGALPKLGLGYEDFAVVNPAIVMLSMSLSGQWGPLSNMKGYAGIMTSMAGLESLVGHQEADGSPLVVGMAKTALGDPNAASHALCVLMAALQRRKETGKGLWIDLSQTDAILSILPGPLVESQLYGQAPVLGNRHPMYAPHGHFTCQGDAEWVAISVQTDAQWQALIAAAGDADLARYAALDAQGRIDQRQEIERALEAWTSHHEPAAVVDALLAARVPVAPVASYQEMSGAPWRARRALTRVVEHRYIGQQEIVVPPWLFAGRSAGIAQAAPLLGENTDEVLSWLAPRQDDVALETKP